MGLSWIIGFNQGFHMDFPAGPSPIGTEVWAKLPWRCEPLTQGRLETAAERCAEVQMRSV